MKENQEIKMQLLDKFGISDDPKSVEFCREAYKFLAEPEPGILQQPQISAVSVNKPDGIYLVFENGSALPYDPEKGIVSDSEIKYIGIKWGSHSVCVALRDQANNEDITLTAQKDETTYDGYIDNYLDAVADWNGKANTEHLKQIGLNKDITLADGEYIPSLGEMLFVFLNRKAINQALEDVGGTPIDGVWYWTSTEYSATGAWHLLLINGGVNGNAKASCTLRVRAVSAFQL